MRPVVMCVCPGTLWGFDNSEEGTVEALSCLEGSCSFGQ